MLVCRSAAKADEHPEKPVRRSAAKADEYLEMLVRLSAAKANEHLEIRNAEIRQCGNLEKEYCLSLLKKCS